MHTSSAKVRQNIGQPPQRRGRTPLAADLTSSRRLAAGRKANTGRGSESRLSPVCVAPALLNHPNEPAGRANWAKLEPRRWPTVARAPTLQVRRKQNKARRPAGPIGFSGPIVLPARFGAFPSRFGRACAPPWRPSRRLHAQAGAHALEGRPLCALIASGGGGGGGRARHLLLGETDGTSGERGRRTKTGTGELLSE